MDYIATDEQGYAEPTFLDGDALQFVDCPDIDDVQDRADLARPDLVRDLVRGAVSSMQLAHLPDLLLDRHLTDEARDALIDRQFATP